MWQKIHLGTIDEIYLEIVPDVKKKENLSTTRCYQQQIVSILSHHQVQITEYFWQHETMIFSTRLSIVSNIYKSILSVIRNQNIFFAIFLCGHRHWTAVRNITYANINSLHCVRRVKGWKIVHYLLHFLRSTRELQHKETQTQKDIVSCLNQCVNRRVA